MHRGRHRTVMQWLVAACIVISGCGPPVTNRLVTVKLVKAPEVEIQRIRTIGVLPFESPEKTIGRQLSAEMVKGLNREQYRARVIQLYRASQSEPGFLLGLGRKANVDGLLLGEITEYSVRASTEAVSMLAYPRFGAVDPEKLSWVSIRENPSIADLFYYRLKSSQAPDVVQVSVNKASYSLAIHLRLIEVKSGTTLWEKRIARYFERISLPGSPIGTEVAVSRIRKSMVEEVVARLRPQETKVKRMLRVPRLTMDPWVAKLVRQGIRAAELEDWKEAENLFLKALAQAPEECTLTGNLGVVYERGGRLLEAVAAYERAYRCEPRDPTYRFYSDDLHTAFVPVLDKKDLPTLVLGVREDGMFFLDGGRSNHHHPGDEFILYRLEVWRDPETTTIRKTREVEFARGQIVEVLEQMSLGRLLLNDPERVVQKGDLIRLVSR